MVAAGAAGAYSAFNQFKGGQQQSSDLMRQGEYNAQIYEQQAGMILNQKKLANYQYNRNAARLRGAVISRTAGAGLAFTGSPVAIAIDNESQMLLDNAVNNYNLDMQRHQALSAASASREQAYQQAKLARAQGFSNAFSTILNTATTLGTMNLGASGAKPNIHTTSGSGYRNYGNIPVRAGRV